MNLIRKIDILYIITFLFLILSSNGSFLAFENIFWFSIMVFFIATAIARKAIGERELRFIGLFSLIYVVFVGFRDIVVNGLEASYLTSDVSFLIKYVFLAFLFVIILKEKILAYIVKVMVHLTIISFFFYFIQIIGFEDTMYRISTALNPASFLHKNGYTNFIIFSITVGAHDYANSGFTWEPGAFGCFLCITLMINFFLNRFTFDKRSIILIIAIITTFSTTTYVALVVLLFLAYRFRAKKFNKWLLLSIPAVVIIFLEVPFLWDKIVDTYNTDMTDLSRLKYLERLYTKLDKQMPLNRFSSMSLIYDTFREKLILGVSNEYFVILDKKINVNISNGIFDFFAKFGVVGLIFVMYRYLKFCYAFVLKAEFLIYCGVLLLILSFGETILHLPFLLIFLFLPMLKMKPAESAAEKARNRKSKFV